MWDFDFFVNFLKWTQDFECCSWQRGSKTAFKIKIPVRSRRAKTQRIERIPYPDIFHIPFNLSLTLLKENEDFRIFQVLCIDSDIFNVCGGNLFQNSAAGPKDTTSSLLPLQNDIRKQVKRRLSWLIWPNCKNIWPIFFSAIYFVTLSFSSFLI